jgi:lysophospholipase L1-like esterase
MRRAFWSALFVIFAAAASAAPPHWVTSWFTGQQIVEPENMIPPEVLRDSTLRQVVHLSIGGSGFRVVLSNAFGAEPLHLAAVHVARPGEPGEIDPVTDRPLTFSGRSDVIIPAGATYLSDPVPMPLAAFSDLAITIHYGEPPVIETGHPGSRATSYIVPGDHVADAKLEGAKTVDHWYQITAVEVMATPHARAVVVVGDSITDGRGSTTNGNDRWTNVLASLLAANRATRHTAVLNAGFGGNRLLNDVKGPNVLARFDRDVLAPPGVASLIVLEGINDIGTLTVKSRATPEEHALLVQRMIAAYQQVAERAHAHGLKAYVGTIMPFMGTDFYHPDAANEADRNAVNAWIRAQKLFDGVIDFDSTMRDPLRPDHLNPAFDTGDMLHPGPAGYRVMGEAAAAALLPGGRPTLRVHVRKKKHP